MAYLLTDETIAEIRQFEGNKRQAKADIEPGRQWKLLQMCGEFDSFVVVQLVSLHFWLWLWQLLPSWQNGPCVTTGNQVNFFLHGMRSEKIVGRFVNLKDCVPVSPVQRTRRTPRETGELCWPADPSWVLVHWIWKNCIQTELWKILQMHSRGEVVVRKHVTEISCRMCLDDWNGNARWT